MPALLTLVGRPLVKCVIQAFRVVDIVQFVTSDLLQLGTTVENEGQGGRP